MRNKKILKNIIHWGTALSVGTAITYLIRQNTESDSKLKNAELYVGAALAGFVAGDIAADHMDNVLSPMIDGYEVHVTPVANPY